MDETRKQIIIHEIENWKKNRLLPVQYCDFLLALYTEGNGIGKKSKGIQGRSKAWLWLLVIPVIMFFIYFTELSLILQISISVIYVFSGMILSVYLYKKGLLFQIPLMITAIIFLFISVEYSKLFFAENVISLYFILVVNCLIWTLIGRKFKLLYFTISGITGLMLLVISIFTPFM